ncbi:NnrS family protein [Sulfurivermis fontis]|jgi:uncharacterized protein involved in response to NO|uniref:NnrS family protein n=1 Tax=Sulfurivermis fontis TaxID=1972068 RepID=UPI000FDCAF4F|nr:NnrS family protein [Sulfurivermis fontis]
MMAGTFWQTFSAAPHRMMMFGGAVQLVAVLLYWSIELFGRYTGVWPAPATLLPGIFAHAFLMIYTLFPFFIFGFLMTTYPRWMSGTAVPPSWYQTAFLLLTGGVMLFYVGLFHSKALLSAGVALLLAGYLTAITALWRVYRTAPAKDKFYETCLNAALTAGTIGVAAFLLWLLSDVPFWLNLSLQAGLWWFLLPIAVSVSHRMIPFFSVCVLPDYQVYQPKLTLLPMLTFLALHGVLELLALHRWLWLVDFPLLLLALLHSWQWQFKRSFAVRLLAILHVAFAWLSVAAALYVINSMALFFKFGPVLGRAPLHAIAIGFLLSITLAMASRVTLGHSGRELRADTTTWVLFWGLSGVAILRIVAELPLGPHFNLLAALTWLCIAMVWSGKYGVIYLRPRLDGKPG